MEILHSLVAVRLMVILGVLNLVTGLLIFLSCRCLPASKIGGSWLKHQWYQKFYKFHCYIWAIFFTSVVVHAFLAYMILGWPF